MKYLVALSIVLIAFGYVITNTRQVTAREMIFNVCNQSRISATIKESQCADLQTSYGIEFLCSERNTNPATYCWTEINNELKED